MANMSASSSRSATSQSAISVLQDLSARAHDSELGYRRSGEDASDADLKQQFEQLANERSSMAAELDRLIREQGGEPSWTGGTTLGAVHRMFVDLKTAMSSNQRQTITAEVARGESAAEQAYDDALRQNLPENAKHVVREQHRRVRETRNRYRAIAGISGTKRSGQMGYRTSGGGATEMVSHYMTERPMMSSLVVFALGFVIGALMSSSMSQSDYGSSRQSYGGRRHDDDRDQSYGSQRYGSDQSYGRGESYSGGQGYDRGQTYGTGQS